MHKLLYLAKVMVSSTAYIKYSEDQINIIADMF